MPDRAAGPSLPVAAVGLILAAGSASRFGADKRQAVGPDGRSLLDIALDAFSAALGTVYVVLPPGDAFGLDSCRRHGAQAVINPRHASGMGSSLSVGIAAIVAGLPSVAAVVVGLADMPAVDAALVERVARRVRDTGRPTLPCHAGTPGHPRGLPRAALDALLALPGDAGARHAVDWSQAERIEMADAGCLLDIDTPAALAAWHAGIQTGV